MRIHNNIVDEIIKKVSDVYVVGNVKDQEWSLEEHNMLHMEH